MQKKFDTTIITLSFAIVTLGAAVMIAFFTYRNFQSRAFVAMPTDTLMGWFWYQDTNHESKGTLTLDHGALRCDCTLSNGKHGSLILTQRRVVAETGHRYHVAFSAKASAPTKITLSGDQGGYGTNSDNIGLDEICLLDEQWSKHEATFTAIGKLGHHVELPKFGVGASLGTVWIKDVIVEEMK